MLALVNNEAHPFILGLRYAFHTPAKLYYVLNFCNGGDLYYLLSRCKKFKEAQARFYASEVFLALQARPAAPPSPRPRPALAPPSPRPSPISSDLGGAAPAQAGRHLPRPEAGECAPRQ